MAKLKLNPNPTFTAKVGIHVPGDESAEVEFTFRHRTKDELQKFIDESSDRSDVDTILQCATGWELSDPFNAESVGILVQNYISAPRAIFNRYIEELARAREKN
jgi:hypothetical protein